MLHWYSYAFVCVRFIFLLACFLGLLQIYIIIIITIIFVCVRARITASPYICTDTMQTKRNERQEETIAVSASLRQDGLACLLLTLIMIEIQLNLGVIFLCLLFLFY